MVGRLRGLQVLLAIVLTLLGIWVAIHEISLTIGAILRVNVVMGAGGLVDRLRKGGGGGGIGAVTGRVVLAIIEPEIQVKTIVIIVAIVVVVAVGIHVYRVVPTRRQSAVVKVEEKTETRRSQKGEKQRGKRADNERTTSGDPRRCTSANPTARASEVAGRKIQKKQLEEW